MVKHESYRTLKDAGIYSLTRSDKAERDAAFCAGLVIGILSGCIAALLFMLGGIP